MNKYEGLFILDPVLEGEHQASLIKQLSDLVVKEQGVVDKVEQWGKRGLGYVIKRKKEGVYVLMHFQINPLRVGEVERVVRLNEHILKSQIIKME